MTFSKIGVDGEIIQEVNPRTGNKEPRFVPHLEATGKEKIALLPKLSRLLGLYIIGLQGMGKSGLFEELILQDIKQDIGVCVLDPHGELVENVIARLPDAKEEKVIYLNLAENNFFFGLNLFACSDPTSDDEIIKTVEQVTHVFEKAFGVSIETTPRIYDYLFNSAYTLIANPGYTLIDLPLLFNSASRQTLLANVSSAEVLRFWDDVKQLPKQDQSKEERDLLRRLNNLSHAPLRFLVGQSSSTVDLQTIMDEGKILLVKLDRRLEQATKLVGSILVAQIVNAANTRQTNKLFNLYADEFQNFATEDFTLLLEQARKQGIGVTMAHQNRSQLELSNQQADKNLKTRTLNVGNIVVFRVPTDAQALAPQFDCTPTPSTETRREQILTVTYDAVNHLLTHGYADKNGKKNKIIDAFITTKLIRLQEPVFNMNGAYALAGAKQYAQTLTQALNNFLYAVMSENNPYQEVSNDLFYFFYYPNADRSSLQMLYPVRIFTASIAASIEQDRMYDKDKDEEMMDEWERSSEPVGYKIEQEARHKLSLLWQKIEKLFPLLWASTSDQGVNIVTKQIYTDCCEVFAEYRGFLAIRGAFKRELFEEKEKRERATWQLKRKEEEKERWETADEYWLKKHYEWYVSWAKRNKQRPIKKEREYLQEEVQRLERECQELRVTIETCNQQIPYYEQAIIDRFQDAIQAERQEVISLLRKDMDVFEAYVFEFRSILQVLATNPIMGPSGQYEEKALPRTFQDMQNERANELGRLPKYTARVKLSERDGNAVEHVIKTIEPERKGMLRGADLQQRIASIHYRNFTDGYISSRTEVEEEIRKRQGGSDNAPGAKGPQGNDSNAKGQAGSPPPRRRKIDPDDELKIPCKECGTLNKPDAKFCNECGKKPT